MDNRIIPSSNEIFGEDRVGMIQMIAGGELQLKESDSVMTNESGILILHGDDKAENITMVPWTNVGFVRTWIPRQRAKKVIDSPSNHFPRLNAKLDALNPASDK